MAGLGSAAGWHFNFVLRRLQNVTPFAATNQDPARMKEVECRACCPPVPDESPPADSHLSPARGNTFSWLRSIPYSPNSGPPRSARWSVPVDPQPSPYANRRSPSVLPNPWECKCGPNAVHGRDMFSRGASQAAPRGVPVFRCGNHRNEVDIIHA